MPKRIGGYETETYVTGKIKALTLLKHETKPSPLFTLTNPRPLYRGKSCGGISIGTNILGESYGTLGVITKLGRYILSCTHVLAQDEYGNHASRLAAKLNKIEVIQPGGHHGEGPVIGYVKDWIAIKYRGLVSKPVNYADAAIANVANGQAIESNRVLDSDDISTYEVDVDGSAIPGNGKSVRKSGATTGVRYRYIKNNNVKFDEIWYGPNKAAIFDDVITVDSGFSAGGNSGSFVDYPGHGNDFVGLLFAGS